MTFPDIIQVLIKSNNNAVFESELVANLLIEFWDENFWCLFWYLVVPFTVYLLFSMAFLLVALDPHSEMEKGENPGAAVMTLGIFSVLLWVY